MDRRQFLQLSASLSLGWQIPSTMAARATNNTLLVLVELKGGNDGLNTLVPVNDPAYRLARPTIALSREDLLPIREDLALHASLAPLLPWWSAGQLAILQGIGYPSPNLSHFRSIDIWETASDSQQILTTGWLSRYFQVHPSTSQSAADGLIFGSDTLGPLAGASALVMSKNLRPEVLDGMPPPSTMPDSARNTPSALQHILNVNSELQHAKAGLMKAPVTTRFPSSPFGSDLQLLASLLAGGTTFPVARVTLSGFDTHTAQLGRQTHLLDELASGLSAFATEMQQQNRWEETLILTYAEFGRRVKENQSGGTDHGTANVHFALGGRVHGSLFGQYPSLTNLDNGNLIATIDFRQLYATILSDWWQVSSSSVLGRDFKPVPFLRRA